ncbi:MAG TPA: excinuclease ABC subunit A [Opitutae bacterium]|nr:excinuclease ABC subunit A [Opitutae bacterium]
MGKSSKATVGSRNAIRIKGAKENNLKGLTVDFPRGKLTGVTGVSGSGKSSLVFDVLAAEGHRKYVESLSAKARQVLEKVKRPEVDFVEGLSPVLAIEQASAGSAGPRSTVASATEIADYARLLWSTVGQPHCPLDGARVTRRSLDDCVEQLLEKGAGKRCLLLAPFLRAKASVLREELPSLERRGFQRIRIDGLIKRLDDREVIPEKTKGRELDVDLLVDRISIDASNRSRIADSLELAFREGQEKALALVEEKEGFEELFLSQSYACEQCGATYPTLTPRHFSWNHPDGACKRCGGLGEVLSFREDLVIPDASLTFGKGVIKPWRLGSRKMINLRKNLIKHLSEQVPFDTRKPWNKQPEDLRKFLLHGDPDAEYQIKLTAGRGKPKKQTFPGILKDLENTMLTTSSENLRERLLSFQVGAQCPDCAGTRLSAYSRSVLLADLSIDQFLSSSAEKAWRFIREIVSKDASLSHVGDALFGLEQRLGFINQVGLGYLTLDRPYRTLSGGEAQRARLATQLGMGLVGVIYALDEPSVGLHPADHDRLLQVLQGLRDRGNTVIVVEHDSETLLACDHLIEVGPGPGEQGGELCFEGDLSACFQSKTSCSGPFLAGREMIEKEARKKNPGKAKLFVREARAHNLKRVDVAFPVGLLTVVCGVSGSGKSSLVNDVLAKSAANELNRAKQLPGAHSGIQGLDHFEKVVRVDQSPIGKSPRSNPATFVKLFDLLRKLFSQCSLSRVRGYSPGRFSFNLPGGRCERCKGDGMVKLDMQFLADVFVECESCKGNRYNRETLEVRFRGRNIAEILDMSVSEAKDLFAKHPAILAKLETLDAVGLGYLKLGQPANTLSGGESQRLKLSLELSKRQTGSTLYLLDEPTTGLHWIDVQRLMDLLFKLRDAGHTIVVIEHNLDVIGLADHVLEIGPDGGETGGNLVFQGDPLSLSKEKTHTGTFLRKHLAKVQGKV